MRQISSTYRAGPRVLPFMLAAVLAAGCDDSNPLGPTPPAPGQPVPQSIAITGPTTLQRPGDAVQLTATATYSDGTIRNVSSEASWSVDHTEIVSVNRGFLTGRGYGQCDVTVTLGQVSARAPVRVIPDGMFMLSGRLTDVSGVPLYPAWVSVTPSDFELRAQTNRQGRYAVPARGQVEVRAEMEGFEPQVRRLTVTGDASQDFELRLRSATFGGMYRLTFTAASSCDLPTEVEQRHYLVRVTEEPSGVLSVVVVSPDMVAMGYSGFTGTRDGSQLQFTISHDYMADYHFIELLDPGRELTLSGTATGVADDTFVTSFSGTVAVRPRSGGAVLAQCQAGDHRLEFTR